MILGSRFVTIMSVSVVSVSMTLLLLLLASSSSKFWGMGVGGMDWRTNTGFMITLEGGFVSRDLSRDGAVSASEYWSGWIITRERFKGFRS